MLRAVADTHAVIWYIFGDARLSTTARNTIGQIAAEGSQVAFSSITLAEIVYLMPDRIIAATALYLNLPVISRDHRIQLSDIDTIW